jgi:hypothetical protein
MAGRDTHFGAEQIGHHSALLHLALNGLRRQAHAHSDCLSLAKLVLQDAQGLVKRIDQEVGNSIADGLSLRGAVRRCNQRSGPGNVGRYHQRAALAVELSRVDQLPAESRLPVGESSFEKARVGSRYEFNKLKSGRGLRLERQVPCSPVFRPAGDPDSSYSSYQSRMPRFLTTSVIALKPATCGQFKTGHFGWPET